MAYKLGSLFDGSGGFPLSGALCGIEPSWAAEVEPYPIAVTRTRFPNMKHLGDISKINGGEIEPVDVITFGSPCQDLSVAGKRAGLKHEANGDEETTRSGLFMEAVRIIKEMRSATNGQYPRFALWENVPGAFSSNNGNDFRVVCEELIKIVEPAAAMPPVPKNGWAYSDSYRGDGWSLAYRTFDAQYWGVPQRRRRIHLVADFRGECAGEVLFEREGVRGYFETGRTPWQAAPCDAEDCTGTADREGESERDGLLIPADPGCPDGLLGGRGLDAVGFLRQLGGVEAQEEVSPTLMAAAGMSGNNKPCVAYSVDSLATFQNTGAGWWNESPVGATLRTPCGGDAVLANVVCMATQQGGAEIMTDKCPTITAAAGMSGNNQPVVAFTQNQRDEVRLLGDKAGSLQAQPGMKQQTFIIDNIGGQAEYAKPSPVFGTLRAGAQGAVGIPLLFENHSQDTRYRGPLDMGPTVSATYGMGGNNQPFVVEPKVFRKGTRPHNADEAQKWEDAEIANTLNTFDQGETRANELVVEPQPVYCLQGNGIDRADTAGCNGAGWREGQSYTLNTIDRPAVAYVTDVGFFNSQKDVSPTLLDRQYKDPHLVSYPQDVQYIVRRLTPTECARLQGFADRWGDIGKKDSLTPEEFSFWHEVRNTHAAINGKKVQDYTEVQILAWYNKLHTDSAEYKMWGNGIALPPALYCMQGIVDALNAEEDDSWML